ncbi:MAG TPA: hypothetical protein VHH36_06385 [Candidatus Thermoplasmatota archaeon]|nr:hypothetical protein [Candidatus Thermoplasmatota archaeon]
MRPALLASLAVAALLLTALPPSVSAEPGPEVCTSFTSGYYGCCKDIPDKTRCCILWVEAVVTATCVGDNH